MGCRKGGLGDGNDAPRRMKGVDISYLRLIFKSSDQRSERRENSN